jgi:hypothetical protein
LPCLLFQQYCQKLCGNPWPWFDKMIV